MNRELLDPAQLAEIRALARVRPEFPERMLTLFLESATEALEGCLGAWMANDVQQLKSFAHRLKGTAASFGAVQLRHQAERLETDASLDVGSQRRCLDNLEHTITATHQAYSDWLQQL